MLTVDPDEIGKYGLLTAVVLGQLRELRNRSLLIDRDYDCGYQESLSGKEIRGKYYFPVMTAEICNLHISKLDTRKAIKQLKGAGVIQTKMIGIPAKRYIYIVRRKRSLRHLRIDMERSC